MSKTLTRNSRTFVLNGYRFDLNKCISVWTSQGGTMVIWIHNKHIIIRSDEYSSIFKDSTLIHLGAYAYDFVKHIEELKENGPR